MPRTSRMNAVVMWCNARSWRVVALATFLAALTSLLIAPLLSNWWHDDLRIGRRLGGYLSNLGWFPISQARVQTYMLWVPVWALAVALGWVVGRILYRRIVHAATVCGASFVLVPEIFVMITMGGANLGWYQNVNVVLQILGMHMISFALLAGTSLLVARGQRRRSPGWCSICGRDVHSLESARCLSCSRLCTTCRYDLTGNTSGVCPECGTATTLPTPVMT